MSNPNPHDDPYEFSPQSDRVSLRAKMVYDPQTDRLGYAVWNEQTYHWSEPKFREPPPDDWLVIVPDHDLAIHDNDTFDAEAAVAQLIGDDQLFVNFRRYVVNDYHREPLPPGAERISDHPTMVVFVNCSDVFAWGTADREEIHSEADLKRLVAHLRRDPVYGSLKWACQTRNEQPQAPWVERLKEVGAWTKQLDSLPPNRYDAWRSEAAE